MYIIYFKKQSTPHAFSAIGLRRRAFPLNVSVLIDYFWEAPPHRTTDDGTNTAMCC